MSSNTQLPALTGLRALAAIWVVVFHYEIGLTSLFPASLVLAPLIDKGFFAVDLFFILSGFILAYTYFDRYRGDRYDYLAFLSHRIARIYPVHLFTLVSLLALLVGAKSVHANIAEERYGSVSFVYNVFLVHSWGLLDWDTWNQPSWSLSAEWFAYVFVFPLAWIALRRISRSIHALALMSLSIVTYVAWTHSPASASLGRFAARVTCEFFVGSCLYVLLKANAFKSETYAVIGFVAAFGLAWFLRSDNQLLAPMMILSFSAIIIGLSQGGPIFAVLRAKPMVYAGELSFSLYMLHVVMQKVFKLVLPSERFVRSSPLVRFEVILAYAILIGIVSIATYELVEKPARAKLRNVLCPPRSIRALVANRGGINSPVAKTVS